MTTNEKFHAAVNVIRGLPKRGSYQPSNELMLRFYSYYKQATEGKCNVSKPGFWDIVNRAKWEAWNKLGNMSSENAMKAYVEELHKIVETMSYTDNVAAFFNTMDDQSDIPISKDDLFLVAGDVFRKNTSSPSPPTVNGETTKLDNGSSCNGYVDSEDEYTDTVEHEEIHSKHNINSYSIPNGRPVVSSSDQSSYESTNLLDTNSRVLEELRKTVSSLENDVHQMKIKLNTVDAEQRNLSNCILLRRPNWWPFGGVSPGLVAVLILWPVLANRIVAMMRRKK